MKRSRTALAATLLGLLAAASIPAQEVPQPDPKQAEPAAGEEGGGDIIIIEAENGAEIEFTTDEIQEFLPAQNEVEEAGASQESLVNQTRRQLRAELWLAAKVCHPTKEQYVELRVSVESIVEPLVTAHLERVGNGDFRRGSPDSDQVQMNHLRFLRDVLGSQLRRLLPGDQAAKYSEECNRQALWKKEMVARSLVAYFDEFLVLSEEQRATMSGKIIENWQAGWNPQLLRERESFTWFSIPDSLVVPYLTEPQYQTLISTHPPRRDDLIYVSLNETSRQADSLRADLDWEKHWPATEQAIIDGLPKGIDGLPKEPAADPAQPERTESENEKR